MGLQNTSFEPTELAILSILHFIYCILATMRRKLLQEDWRGPVVDTDVVYSV